MEADPHWACPLGFLETQFPLTQRAEPQTWEKPVQTQRFSVGMVLPSLGQLELSADVSDYHTD